MPHIIPFIDLAQTYSPGSRITDPRNRAEYNVQMIRRIQRGREILGRKDDSRYREASQYFDEAASLIIATIHFAYTAEQKVEFVKLYREDKGRPLSECSDSNAVLEIAARCHSNLAKIQLLASQRICAATRFRAAGMILYTLSPMNTDQMKLMVSCNQQCKEAGYSHGETFGMDDITKNLGFLARDNDYHSPEVIPFVAFALKKENLPDQSKQVLINAINTMDCGSIEGKSKTLVLRLCLPHTNNTEDYETLKALRSSLVTDLQAAQYSASSSVCINLFLAHQLEVTAQIQAGTAARKDVMASMKALYDQALSSGGFCSTLLEIAHHTMYLLEPPLLFVPAIEAPNALTSATQGHFATAASATAATNGPAGYIA
jgi:hypothetical protein